MFRVAVLVTLALRSCSGCATLDVDADGAGDTPSMMVQSGAIHNTAECGTCHDLHGRGQNRSLISDVVTTPNSGDRAVVFLSYTGDDSFADGSVPLDGICEVCHTSTTYHLNDGTGEPGHHTGENCTDLCHRHENGFAAPGRAHRVHTELGGRGPELACLDCHPNLDPPLPDPVVLVDGLPLATTTACDTCHSPGGAYDGVATAKAYWLDGVYVNDALQDELWCVGCHDDDPANSAMDGTGVDAPPVGGDDFSWGYYATGHGRSYLVTCTDCHDPGLPHLDGLARTYEIDESNGYAEVSPYCESYRLAEVDGGDCLDLLTESSPNPINQPERFAVCARCHELDELIVAFDPSGHESNFYGDPTVTNDLGNSHRYHVRVAQRVYDSDFDGQADAYANCVTCHNVHGSASPAMIRSGELIGKEPALNFSYLIYNPGDWSTAEYRPNLPADGVYDVYGWWKAESRNASNTLFAVEYDGGTEEVTQDQQQNNGTWVLLGSWDFLAGTDGSVVISTEDADGRVIADAVRWVPTFSAGWPDTIVDNEDATFNGDWTYQTAGIGYGANYRWHAKELWFADPTATLSDSVGGLMQGGQTIATNGVCNACHALEDDWAYFRTPDGSPRVWQASASPSVMVGDGVTPVLFVATPWDPEDGVAAVEIDLAELGGSATQAMYDDGTQGDAVAGDGIWSLSFTPDSGEGSYELAVTVTDTAGDVGYGAISFELSIDATATYVDDADGAPAFDMTCDWSIGTADGVWGTSTRYLRAGSGSCVATWTPSLPADGDYEVFAWWSQRSNRATDAPYTVNYAGGSVTLDMDQQVNGSTWVSLGVFPFVVASPGSVELSDDANGFVMADAIKFVPQ